MATYAIDRGVTFSMLWSFACPALATAPPCVCLRADFGPWKIWHQVWVKVSIEKSGEEDHTASKRGLCIMPHRTSSSLYDPGRYRNAGKSCPVTVICPSWSFSSILCDVKKGHCGIGKHADSLPSGASPKGRWGRAFLQSEGARIHGRPTCFPLVGSLEQTPCWEGAVQRKLIHLLWESCDHRSLPGRGPSPSIYVVI